MTPEGAPLPSLADSHAVSPLYLIVYPHSAANAVGTMNCAREGGDNCPDHGLGIADLAQAKVPGVYGNGVWGHDHIMDGPGGSHFNVVWKVVVVLFTNAAAANALDRGDAMAVDPSIVFNCNLVSPATCARVTPIAPVVP